MPVRFRWERDFKDTEIGKIPRDWEVRQLGKNYEILMGQSPSSKYYNSEGEGLPFAQGNIDFEDIFINPKVYTTVCHKIAPSNSLLVTVRAPVGEVNLTKKELCIGRGLASIFPKFQEGNEFSTLMNLYMFYIFKALKDYIQQLGDRGTTYQSITKKELEDFEYPSPNNYNEQSRIAQVLSWFDELIEIKKKQNEILEKTAMAIFKSWFIDFEPFQNEEFVYSEELGREIPKGWEVKPTTEIVEYNPKVKLEKGKIYPFVEMKMVNTNSLVCDYEFKTFSGSGVKYYGGDTLMARITPSLEHGKTALVWFITDKEKGFGSTEFFVLHPKHPWLREYVYLLAKNEEFRDVAINSMSGTSGRQRADVEALKNFLIPIPPSPVLQKFHSLVQPLFEKIINNQKEIMILKKVRDTLLPLLVFGKLRVEEV